MCRADLARVRWAFDGGLKDESRMKRVLGEGAGVEAAFIVFTTRKRDFDAWKVVRAEVSSGRMLRSLRGEDAMVCRDIALLIVDWCGIVLLGAIEMSLRKSACFGVLRVGIATRRCSCAESSALV